VCVSKTTASIILLPITEIRLTDFVTCDMFHGFYPSAVGFWRGEWLRVDFSVDLCRRPYATAHSPAPTPLLTRFITGGMYAQII